MSEWKKINGYENYEVSNDGRVRNTRTDMFLSGSVNNSGYLTVGLSKDRKTKIYPMHRLVALAFIDNPDKKEYVRHHDGDNMNNDVFNLYWMSCEEYRLWDYQRLIDKNVAWREAEKIRQQVAEAEKAK